MYIILLCQWLPWKCGRTANLWVEKMAEAKITAWFADGLTLIVVISVAIRRDMVYYQFDDIRGHQMQ